LCDPLPVHTVNGYTRCRDLLSYRYPTGKRIGSPENRILITNMAEGHIHVSNLCQAGQGKIEVKKACSAGYGALAGCFMAVVTVVSLLQIALRITGPANDRQLRHSNTRR